MHFQNIPDGFKKEDIHRKLQEHMPAYSKTGDLTALKNRIQNAISAGELTYDCGSEAVSIRCPSTNLHSVVRCIIERKIDW
jgi:hypothetical protein